MPSLIDIRRRIRAVKSTQQITKAMKMIAASRLRKAQERILSARPYARELLRVLGGLAARVEPGSHPLLALRDERTPGARVLVVVITADRGLCGSFNTNILKAAGNFIVQHPSMEVRLALVGRKGRDVLRHRGVPVRHERINVFSGLRFEDAKEIAAVAIEDFTTGAVESVYLAYNEFKSVLQQRVVVEKLLPIPRSEIGPDPAAAVDYLYEPSAGRILETLLPRFVEYQIFRALLESAAAEHAARMTAMDTATKNSGELIETLTLNMNKVRQAAITREIIEVVSGAQAL
jgi:F-type H+-transporting ATPase subunit gamma